MLPALPMVMTKVQELQRVELAMQASPTDSSALSTKVATRKKRLEWEMRLDDLTSATELPSETY